MTQYSTPQAQPAPAPHQQPQLPAQWVPQQPPPNWGPPPWGPPQHNHYPPPGWYPPAPRTSDLAGVSLVFGILWLAWFGSLIAVITGHLAMRECRETGASGKLLAEFGLALGYLGISIWVLLFVVMSNIS